MLIGSITLIVAVFYLAAIWSQDKPHEGNATGINRWDKNGWG